MKIDNQQTFSELIKQEICTSKEITSTELKYATLSILKNIGDYSLFEGTYELKTRYVFIIKMMKSIFKIPDEMNAKIDIAAIQGKTLKDNKTNYILWIKPKEPDEFFTLFNFDQIEFDENNAEKIRGILMGAFLSGGSANNPFTGKYHLEFRTTSDEYKDLLVKILNFYQINAKTLFRKNKWIVYIKRSAEISDILKLLKTSNAMFFLEDNRIERDLVNNMQRLVNLEVFNMQKASKASVQQVSMCKVLMTSIYFNQLKPREKLYCEIRVKHPEATMNEICRYMNLKLPEDQKITKGSLSHVVQKVKKLYEQM